MHTSENPVSVPKATKIMFIRHAEKPQHSGAPHGVNRHGNHDKESLIVQGWQRAGALADFFAPAFGPLQHPELATPDFLYASAIAKHSHSERPEETIIPLSEKAGLPINTGFDKDDYPAMLRDAMGCDGSVLVCWEHQDIPAIANLILGDTTTAPQQWPDNRFDLVWVFDLDTATGNYGFRQVPQCLLAGDSDSIISGDEHL